MNMDFRGWWVGWTPQNRDDWDYMYSRGGVDRSHHRAIQRFLEDWESNPPECWDDAYEEREVAWEAWPDYDELMERGDSEVPEEEDPSDTLYAWLEEGCRPIPNRG